MSQISAIYSQCEPLKKRQPKPVRQLTAQQVERKAAIATERARLVSLVRSNGFPECRSGVRLATLRHVLKQKGVKF